MYAENFYGQWVCTHCQRSTVSTYVDSSTQTGLVEGRRGGGRPQGLPRVRDVLPGRGGLDRTTKEPEPTSRAACCPLRV